MIKNVIKDNRGSVMVEFAICGTLFVGIVLAMLVVSIWLYNASQVSQAARLAAYHVSVTNNPSAARQEALEYLDKTLIACSNITVSVGTSGQMAYGTARTEMDSLFPGIQKIIDPAGRRTIGGKIRIEKEAESVREERFR